MIDLVDVLAGLIIEQVFMRYNTFWETRRFDVS